MIEESRTSRSAFEALALRELPVLYRVAARMVRQPADAEDLVSQTLLQAARAWNRFDGRYGRSWLIKIMRNEHAARLRGKAAQTPMVSLDDAPDLPGTDEEWAEVENRLLGEDILAALDRIPEEYRLAIALFDIEGMSYQEAADALDVPIGTLRSRLFRGRRLLREKLGWQQCEVAAGEGGRK